MVRIPLGRGLISAALGLLLLASWMVLPAKADSVEFTDIADDAYRYPDPVPQVEPKPPNPLLSNATADITVVGFATAPPPRPDHERAYTVSVTVAGEPDPSFEYFAGAQFGDRCFLFHPLRPGQATEAGALCPQEPENPANNRYIRAGSIEATQAVVSGRTVTATFSFRESTLPDSLAEQPQLGPLWAFACPYSKDEAYDYGCSEVYDFARDHLAKFQI